MRSRSALHHLKLAVLLLAQCASPEAPRAPSVGREQAATTSAAVSTDVGRATPAATSPPLPSAEAPPPAPSAAPSSLEPAPATGAAPEPEARCAGVPPLGADGAVPAPPPHTPLGQNVDVPGDRPAYVLPGNTGDHRVIVYLHGMCGDVTAPDYFRESLRQRGTLLALRGDSPCAGDRFKWRDDPARILQRVRAALERLNQLQSSELSLDGAILFGYSQGADRAEKLAQRYPKLFPRVILGGPPMRASASRLAGVRRVAILGGELETTDTMRAGAEALQVAGIACRFFLLECAYHGHYGTRAEEQLSEVLDWVAVP